MQDISKAVAAEVKTQYQTQRDPERTRLQSDALRICGSEHRLTQQWTQGDIPDTEFHAKAIKHRQETARHYPDAKFKLGDSVRFEQKPMHIYGYVQNVDIFKGMFLYTVAFIDGDTQRINEAHLHQWNTTPINEQVQKNKWVGRSIAERYIRRFGGRLYICVDNPWWLILKTRDKRFRCYVSG